VELVEAAAEPAVRDDVSPGLADERGAEEARRLIGREAEEDLLDELVRRRLDEMQRRRRRNLFPAHSGRYLALRSERDRHGPAH
jgi:hypothetical protein